jgi:hypothetical protein
MKEKIKSKVKIAPNGCWEWQGAINAEGYGGLGRAGKAHRASYEAFIGPIPPGLWVLHNCDNRCCVNPDHLYVGTAKDNRKDFMDRHPRAFEIMRMNMAAANAKLTKEQRKVYAKMGAEALWSGLSNKERKKRATGVRKFWSGMNQQERAEFLSMRLKKIRAGHENRNLHHAAFICNQEGY